MAKESKLRLIFGTTPDDAKACTLIRESGIPCELFPIDGVYRTPILQDGYVELYGLSAIENWMERITKAQKNPTTA